MEIRKHGECCFMAGNWPLCAGRPTVIFIHGAALSKGLWAAQVEALSDIANTIAIDLPGHKDAAGPACDRVSDYAVSVCRFVEGLKISHPVLCGMSMGGAIALELLITRPDIFRSAILMHTGARLKVLPFIFETIEKDYSNYLDMVVEFSISKKSDLTRLKLLMNDIAVLSPEVAVKDFTACDQFDVMEKLGQIMAKVLVVTGGEDAVTPPKYGQYLQKGIPDAGLSSIAEAGHLSPIEKPEQVNQLIRDFLSGRCFKP
ncbi:MAG: alpha/beta fold hydrolase [Desulfosalsimonadaceae bacterium]